jgi:hypothetical protein
VGKTLEQALMEVEEEEELAAMRAHQVGVVAGCGGVTPCKHTRQTSIAHSYLLVSITVFPTFPVSGWILIQECQPQGCDHRLFPRAGVGAEN